MLRTILLIIISILNTQSFANNFIIKYEDYTKNNVVTEAFAKSEDFANRLSELEYINHDSINIIKANYENTNLPSVHDRTTILAMKRGGEGIGD